MKKYKTIWFAVIIIGFIASIWGFNYLRSIENYKRDVQAIQVQNVDLSTIVDGEYFGDCDVDFVRARVRIVVKQHVIEELELLEHLHERGSAAEALPSKILSEQRIDIDVITGATSSSKVIQEAVYNALTSKRTIRTEKSY